MKAKNFIQILMDLRDTHKGILKLDSAASYMGLQKSYLYRLTSERKIKHYKSAGGSLIYFKKEDLDNWMCRFPVKTKEEINQMQKK